VLAVLYPTLDSVDDSLTYILHTLKADEQPQQVWQDLLATAAEASKGCRV
jgi:hypothetical protein